MDTTPSTPSLSWGSIPPRGYHKRTAHLVFSIPGGLYGTLLPLPDLSLKGLTDFPFPPQSTKHSTIGLASYFSKGVPMDMSPTVLLKLQHLLMPEPIIIRQLVEFSRQAWLDGFQSVCYVHLADGAETTTSFPMWVITYWNTVLDIKKISTKWIKSHDWITVQLKQKKSVERRQLAQTASIMLTNLPWGKSKPKEFSEGGPIHALWRYLGPNWLASNEEDDLLELVRGSILDSPELCSIFRIQNTYFTNKLLSAFESGADYHSNKVFAWLRSLGEDLSTEGSTLLTIVHLGAITESPHWVPLMIKKGEIAYGDSFGTGMPTKLEAACQWWLQQHDLSPTPQPISIRHLSITTQIDGHSCGILAHNSLQHLVDPIRNPLLDSPPGDIIQQRLKLFNTVAQNIIARVCTYSLSFMSHL